MASNHTGTTSNSVKIAASLIALESILESSSSSSEDEMQELLLNYLKEERPKIRNYIEIINEYSDYEFQRNFRLQRSAYKKLKERSRFAYRRISTDQALLGFLC